jgi:two-component system, NarL family, nitrate/nitrite response regulator NarP
MSDTTIKPVRRVLIAERNPLVVAALRGLFEEDGNYDIAGVVTSASGLYGILADDSVDFVLLAWSLADAMAPEIIANINKLAAPPKIILFADHANSVLIADTINLGVHGLCYQFEDPSVLFITLQAVGKGRICIPYSEIGKIAITPFSTLTSREKELLAMLGQGWTNTQIASRTGISENTVKYHLKNLYDKLDVKNRAMAVSLFVGERRSHG